MRLCDEYALRMGFDPPAIKKADKAFLLYGRRDLLSITWMPNGCHPGFYEFAEYRLDDSFRLRDTHNVQWEDYESFVRGWLPGRKLVESRSDVFRFSWEFFLRSRDRFLSLNFSPHEVMETIKGDDWMHKAVLLLDKIGEADKAASDFWWSRVGEIYEKYAFWMCDIARSGEIRTTLSL